MVCGAEDGRVESHPERRKALNEMKMEKYLLLALAIAVLLIICRFFYNR